MSLPPPRQPLSCENPDCGLPDGGRCARIQDFDDPLEECPSLARLSPGETGDTTAIVIPNAHSDPTDDTHEPAPWLGEALGPQEVDELLWRSHPVVLAVLGPYDAGKTCLITSFFLQLANGQRDDFPYRFASSRSLYGFYGLAARANRWQGDQESEVLAHTPTAGQDCRFLHLGLRPTDDWDDRHIDVLISDMPGEWAEDWAQRQDESSRRRLAFFDRADGVLVLADAAKLVTDRKYGAQIARLMQRCIDRISNASQSARPPTLCLVYTKLDMLGNRPQGEGLDRSSWGDLGGSRTKRIWSQLERAVDKGLSVHVFGVSAFAHAMALGQPEGVTAPFATAVMAADTRRPVSADPPPIATTGSAFETLRIWRSV